MYAKFVIYDESNHAYNGIGVSSKDGNKSEKVVPCHMEIFEGGRIRYQKIATETFGDLAKITSGLGSYALLTDLPGKQVDENSKMDGEFILVSIYKSESHDESPTHYISAADTVLFIMNDNGKTIDRLACRNNH